MAKVRIETAPPATKGVADKPVVEQPTAPVASEAKPLSRPKMRVVREAAAEPAKEDKRVSQNASAQRAAAVRRSSAKPNTNAATAKGTQQSGGVQDEAKVAEGESSQPSSSRLAQTQQAASGWVHRTFAGHEHAFWGGAVAVLVALLIFAIGFLRVLFIGLLVCVGVAVGQVLDGDPKIIRMIRDLFLDRRDQE